MFLKIYFFNYNILCNILFTRKGFIVLLASPSNGNTTYAVYFLIGVTLGKSNEKTRSVLNRNKKKCYYYYLFEWAILHPCSHLIAYVIEIHEFLSVFMTTLTFLYVLTTPKNDVFFSYTQYQFKHNILRFFTIVNINSPKPDTTFYNIRTYYYILEYHRIFNQFLW